MRRERGFINIGGENLKRDVVFEGGWDEARSNGLEVARWGMGTKPSSVLAVCGIWFNSN